MKSGSQEVYTYSMKPGVRKSGCQEITVRLLLLEIDR